MFKIKFILLVRKVRPIQPNFFRDGNSKFICFNFKTFRKVSPISTIHVKILKAKLVNNVEKPAYIWDGILADLGEPPVLSFQTRPTGLDLPENVDRGWKLSTAASDTERERVCQYPIPYVCGQHNLPSSFAKKKYIY